MPSHALKRSTLLALCACALVAQSMVAAVNLLIPQLSSSTLHPTHTEVLWTVDAYVIVFASLLIPMGAVGDRYGRKGALLAGLALFAVAGAEKALIAGSAAVVAIAMGVITATFGGMIRDVLGAESPVVLSREIYVTAALLGACAFVGALSLDLSRESAIVGGFTLAFLVRGAALWWGWSLPRYRSKPVHEEDLR